MFNHILSIKNEKPKKIKILKSVRGTRTKMEQFTNFMQFNGNISSNEHISI